jgi:hypothetical protein
MAPNLLAAVHPWRWNKRIVASALEQNAWLCNIVGALTIPVLMQYVEIRERLETIVLNPSSPDATIW